VRLYFDWNSTTPPIAEARAAAAAAWADAWGNPASVHAEGRAARALLEASRRVVAELCGARPDGVVWTSGGTEASNLALSSPFEDGRGALVLAPLEHASVTACAEALARRGVQVRYAEVSRSGHVDVDSVARRLAEGDVRLVAIQAVNGETGVVQPFAEIAALAHAKGAVVHVDAVQGVGRIPPPPGGWVGVADTVALAAHKIGGLRGIGALVLRPGHPLRPLLRGGSQERGLRPGTQDAALTAAFAAAARVALQSVATYEAVRPLRDRFEGAVAGLGALVNGASPRVAHVVHVSFPGWSSPELVAALDLEGLACSGGAACHAGVTEPSSTLKAMFHAPADAERLLGPVRFSLPPHTTAADVDRAVAVVRRVLERRPPPTTS